MDIHSTSLPQASPTQGYDPELYAALHRGTEGDYAFYAGLQADRVLELGCGFGRLLDALAVPKRTYVGLDIDWGLLRLADAHLRRRHTKRRSPKHTAGQAALVRADMTQFAFNTQFDLIVLPFSGLFCLPSAHAVHHCFENVRRHLAPRGRFIIDAYCLDAFHSEAGDDEQLDSHEDWVARVNARGTTFDVYEGCLWNRGQQQLDTTYRYAPLSGGAERFGRIAHHYLLSNQLRSLLRRAGLGVERAFGGFHGEPFDPEGDHLLWICRPAGNT